MHAVHAYRLLSSPPWLCLIVGRVSTMKWVHRHMWNLEEVRISSLDTIRQSLHEYPPSIMCVCVEKSPTATHIHAQHICGAIPLWHNDESLQWSAGMKLAPIWAFLVEQTTHLLLTFFPFSIMQKNTFRMHFCFSQGFLSSGNRFYSFLFHGRVKVLMVATMVLTVKQRSSVRRLRWLTH